MAVIASSRVGDTVKRSRNPPSVANIPYYITTPLLFRLLEYKGCLQSLTLTLQKEVAERIVAGPGGKAYGVLSIAVHYAADAKLKFVVPRGSFRPVPKVDSAVIHLKILEQPVIEVMDEETFFRVVKTAFSQRRKMLVNALKPLSADIREILLIATLKDNGQVLSENILFRSAEKP